MDNTMWERTARRIEADALDDLAGHRKLQSPEGQQFLNALRRYHNERTDPLMPWLAREFRKGRIEHVPSLPESDAPDILRYNDAFDPEYYPGIREEDWVPTRTRLSPETLNHWADWYHQSDRRKVPLEQLKVHDLPGEVERYQHERSKSLKDEAVEEGRHQGEVVHQFPDGWNVRRLPAGPALDFEAWHMRGDPDPHDSRHPHGTPICVNWPQYHDLVGDGRTSIYSLRDPRGYPHVTMELRPKEWINNTGGYHDANDVYNMTADERGRWGVEPTANRGTIQQIQGKGNSIPKPEYQARMKDWFQTFSQWDKPQWPESGPDTLTNAEDLEGYFHDPDEWWANQDGYGNDGHGGYGPHGDYGLEPEGERGVPPVDYPTILDRTIDDRRPDNLDDDDIDRLYRAAIARGEIPELAQAAERYREMANDSYNDLEEMNYDFLGSYPGESWDEDPEELRRQYEWDYGPIEDKYETPEEQEAALQEYWQDKKAGYDYAQKELYDSHVPSKVAERLHKRLEPHHYPPDAENEGFSHRNQPRWPTMMEHLRPNTEEVAARDLPPGSFYGTLYGNVHKLDPDRLPHERLIPTHIHTPDDPWPPQQAQEPQQTLSRVTVASAHPVRKLWAFSPQSGQVHLYDEGDHHPTEVPTHESIARKLGEVGLHHGYAYTIPGGWRVLDYHHQPVADPYVLRFVVNALRKHRAEDPMTVFESS
jgi:hypothetical protein